MGTIGPIIDRQSLGTDPTAGYPKMCPIAGNVFAIVYKGADGDGFVDTYTIDGLGNITGPLDTYEFETFYCAYPEIVPASGNYYAIIYVGGSPSNLRLVTIQIANDGTITKSITSSAVLWANAPYEEPRIMPVNGTTDKFLYTYDLNLASGQVGTRTINASGIISAEIDFLTFDAARALRVHTTHVTGEIYVVVYQGPDDDGFAKTFSVDSSGNISNAVLDTLEFDTDQCAYPEITQVSGIYYLIAYMGTGNLGKMVTITIDAAGDISNAVVNSYTFDATQGSDPSLTKVGSYLQFAVAYSGETSHGWIKTVPISALGIIGVVESSLEFNNVQVMRTFIMRTSSNIYVVAYRYNLAPKHLRMITTTITTPPSVTTDPATLVEDTTATLNGTLDDDGGEACDCGFQYGESIAYGSTTPTQSRTTGQTFAQAISGLDPNKTYHFRAFGTNSEGTSYGADRTFTTLAGLATVITDPATLVAANSATLNGTLDNDGGEACDCGFEWGETIAYGNTTPTQSRTTGQTFAQAIAGLDPYKTYHFRAVATSGAGTSYGTDRTFMTPAALPAVTSDPITGASTLNGTLDDDGGMACDCGFEWGLTVAYGNITPTQSRTTGQTFSQILGGLVPGTTYHYRALATNGAGTSNGADRTFATPAGIPVVTTNPATGIGMILAALNGTLDDDGGEICECGFEWGADSPYGLTTPAESKITGETFSQGIRGLFPGRVYHFRSFATNSHGTGYGDDESFNSKPSVSRSYALAREEL